MRERDFLHVFRGNFIMYITLELFMREREIFFVDFVETLLRRYDVENLSTQRSYGDEVLHRIIGLMFQRV